jgi:hypothetical protein
MRTTKSGAHEKKSVRATSNVTKNEVDDHDKINFLPWGNHGRPVSSASGATDLTVMAVSFAE